MLAEAMIAPLIATHLFGNSTLLAAVYIISNLTSYKLGRKEIHKCFFTIV
jgi:hypothetical protein